MRKIFQISILLVLFSFTYSQNNTSKSLQGAFGAVTIDGKIWNQIALRPIIPIGKISVALDIVFYIDQDGNVHDDEWDFSTGEKSKNSIIDNSDGDYIFHIDSDEYPHETLLEQIKLILEVNDVDVIWVPRVNTVEGITQEHIEKWGWKTTEQGWINYPDYQSRVFRNKEGICWNGKVHEQIIGCENYSHLPPHEELSLYHPKTITKQEEQNELYQKIMYERRGRL